MLREAVAEADVSFCRHFYTFFIRICMYRSVQGWLAADFQKERERHRTNAKKISRSVDLYHKTKETKKIKKVKVLQLARILTGKFF